MEPDGDPAKSEVFEDILENNDGGPASANSSKENSTIENISSDKESSKPVNGAKRETTNIQIGNRSATLYLSSHSLKSRDDTNKLPEKVIKHVNSSDSLVKKTPPTHLEKQTTTQSLDRKLTKKKSKDRIIPDEMLQLRVKKEFTFTGYDIMADGIKFVCLI